MSYSDAFTVAVPPPEHGSLVRAIRALPNPLAYDTARHALASHIAYVRSKLPTIPSTSSEIRTAIKNTRATAAKIEDYSRTLEGSAFMPVNERAQVIQFLGSLYGEVSAYIGVSNVVVSAREGFFEDVAKELDKTGKTILDAATTAGKLTLFFGALIPYLPLIAIVVAIFLQIRYEFFTKLLGIRVGKLLK